MANFFKKCDELRSKSRILTSLAAIRLLSDFKDLKSGYFLDHLSKSKDLSDVGHVTQSLMVWIMLSTNLLRIWAGHPCGWFLDRSQSKKMKFGAKTHSKSSSNLSVGAQTLWSCSTHQFYNFWKFHQKLLIFSEVIDDFRFHPQSFLCLQTNCLSVGIKMIEGEIENRR